MSFELDKTYDPGKYEGEIYAQWEASGAFKPRKNPHMKPFTIILPPPNANGNLHTGHAMYVVEDVMVRYRRMQGHPTLWLPGADHAGIETQVVFERELAKAGKSRFDLGRDDFYRQVWDFTQTNLANMTTQLRSLGFSLDWSRLQFTLDESIVTTVYDTFKRLQAAGYVYRANRIVNWCPYCRSAFADIEIKYREQVDPLYYIKYGPFVLATVRPETKFGDTAIAVHPNDERYARFVGTTIAAEDLNGPVALKVIADSYVNPEFGTGAVKVTPAHDPNDWEMGVRHKLEVKQVIGTDGLLTELAGRYAGMPVTQARTQVAHDLEERGLMDHIDESYTHNVAYHDRCGTLIEPLVVEQWWLSVDKLKLPAIAAIKSGAITFVPERFTKLALDWLDNLHDWNISRQNWWGIRIPAYYNATGNPRLPEYVIGSEADARTVYGEGGYEAETDNFDTWFSSGQWPFATLMATGDFERGFYPTAVMETGRDILYLWVTRMIMFGLFRTGEVPFTTVYLHGMVTDGSGKKMSKSKGNVINPLEMTSRYGTDALRLALLIGITPGNDGALSENKIEGYRNFCNKLWNVARYILGQLPDDYSPTAPTEQSIADSWILERLAQTTALVTAAIEDYCFSDAGQAVYSLLWDDFADWYVEASKVSVNHDLLIYGLERILTLAHPLAPFVTEAIWSSLPWHHTQLITEQWPNKTLISKSAQHTQSTGEFEDIRELISLIRSIIADERLVKPQIVTIDKVVFDNASYIKRLARVSEVQLVEQGSGLYVSSRRVAWIAATPAQIEARTSRLSALRREKDTYLTTLNVKLANTRFVESAPAHILEDTRTKREETLMLLSKIDEQLTTLNQ